MGYKIISIIPERIIMPDLPGLYLNDKSTRNPEITIKENVKLLIYQYDLKEINKRIDDHKKGFYNILRGRDE